MPPSHETPSKIYNILWKEFSFMNFQCNDKLTHKKSRCLCFFNQHYMYKSIWCFGPPTPYLGSAHKQGSCSIHTVPSVFNDRIGSIKYALHISQARGCCCFALQTQSLPQWIVILKTKLPTFYVKLWGALLVTLNLKLSMSHWCWCQTRYEYSKLSLISSSSECISLTSMKGYTFVSDIYSLTVHLSLAWSPVKNYETAIKICVLFGKFFYGPFIYSHTTTTYPHRAHEDS